MSVRRHVLHEVPYNEDLKYGIDYPWIKELANYYKPWEFGRVKADLGI